MARVVWKGAIVFGLVHIPVDLYPGSKDERIDFDWIDKRDMAPVGNQRINKKTGKRGEKGYALLRETLKRSDKAGIAQVVIHNRQHLAAVIPIGEMLGLMKRIEVLATKGRTHLVRTPAREDEETGGAQVIDLMAALKRSLDKKAGGEPPARRVNENGKPAAHTALRSATTKARSTRSVKTTARKRA